MSPDGSGKRRLLAAQHGARWSPDGQNIAFVGIGDDIYVMNTDGSEQKRLTTPVVGECDGRAQWNSGPAWSPSGRAVAFTRRFCGFFDGVNKATSEIRVTSLDGSEERLLTRHTARDNDPYALAWSPRGNEIAFVSRPGGSLEIYVVNAERGEQRRLTRNTVRDSNPVWSPDGRRVAFERDWQVWVMNADGTGQRRLTYNGARNFAPAWSPDGRSIAFERRVGRVKYSRCSRCGRASGFEVWVMHADGSEARMLAQDGAQPSWSPDGQRLAFQRQSDIYVMNADGSRQRNLTRAAGNRESRPVWSPGSR
jgi:TolB protein